MDFTGKKFQYTEYAKGYEGNRGKFAKLSDVEKYVWTNQYENEELWRTMYSYCDIEHLEVSFGPYYFESDIADFETNRKVVLYAVNFLNVEYDIPLDAFKFKFTNKSIWVEVIPSVMGIKPSYYLNEIFKEITLYLNKTIYQFLGVANAFDTNVYSPRQFSRVVGSYLPESNRYVIELTYHELSTFPYSKILNMAKYRKKVTYPPNSDFNESRAAKHLFEQYRQFVYEKNRKNNNYGFSYISDNSKERLCIRSMEQNGVEAGNRNVALFYASIDKRDKGVTKEDWEQEVSYFMRNFEKSKIDSLSQIRATVKSAYKEKYAFSCRKIRENMPEHCHCEHCPFAKYKMENAIIIYRKQIEVLLKANANVQLYKDLFLFHYFQHIVEPSKCKNLKKLKELKDLGLLIHDNEINPVYQTGSYIKIPLEFMTYLDVFKSEFILYVIMLYCSFNGTTLNPKMNLHHYANKLGKSVRTIQRQFKTLKEKYWIDESTNRVSFVPNVKEESELTDIATSTSEEMLDENIRESIIEEEEAADPILPVSKTNCKKKECKRIYIFIPYVDLHVSKMKKRSFLDKDYRKQIAIYGLQSTVP